MAIIQTSPLMCLLSQFSVTICKLNMNFLLFIFWSWALEQRALSQLMATACMANFSLFRSE